MHFISQYLGQHGSLPCFGPVCLLCEPPVAEKDLLVCTFSRNSYRWSLAAPLAIALFLVIESFPSARKGFGNMHFFSQLKVTLCTERLRLYALLLAILLLGEVSCARRTVAQIEIPNRTFVPPAISDNRHKMAPEAEKTPKLFIIVIDIIQMRIIVTYICILLYIMYYFFLLFALFLPQIVS